MRSQEEFDEGLLDLLEEVVEEITKWRRSGYRAFVNATPGFKAEVSFLVIASLLTCIDTIYYSHESFRELVTIPGLPLTIRREYIEKLSHFNQPLEPKEAEEALGSPETLRDLEIRGLIESREGKYATRKWVKRILEITPRECI